MTTEIHNFYLNLIKSNSKEKQKEKILSKKLDFKKGIIHISGKNGAGKTTFIKTKLLENENAIQNLNFSLLELTSGKLADYLLEYFSDIPFEEIAKLVKKDIINLTLEIAFEKGKIHASSIVFDKETLNVPLNTLELLVNLETDMKNSRTELKTKLKENSLKKIKGDLKKIKGVYFTKDYILGTDKFLDTLYNDYNSISKIVFLETQLKLQLLEKDHFTDHSKLLNTAKNVAIQNEIQKKYSKISLESISEIKKIIVEKELQLKKLKGYKSELVTRKYQKAILKEIYKESNIFINENCFLKASFVISEKGSFYNKVKFTAISSSEKIILELLFRLYLATKIGFDFICIDELLDKISDIKDIENLLSLLLSDIKNVFLVTHRSEINSCITFSETIKI